MKFKSFRLKLTLSYIFVVLVPLVLIAVFLLRNLGEESLGNIQSSVVLFGLLLALGLAFVLGSLVAGNIIKPIKRMTQVSRKYSEGDFSRRIIQPAGDEIGQLALTLNKMAQEIESRIKEINAQNQKLAAIFNNMSEGVMVVDKAGYIVSVNPAAEQIFGMLKKDLEGRSLLEAIRNNDLAEIISAALKTKAPGSGQVTLLLPVRRVFEVNVTPIFDRNIVNGCLLVVHDITKMRMLETMRSDFVANVSHELKTPLTSIKGFVETLLEGALEDKENNRKFLAIIQEHAARLENLVNDLLSLAHLESREITLDKQGFNLRQQLQEVVSGFSTQLKNMDIEVKIDLPVGISVSADRNRIGQVFTNLIDNAIKFNKRNGWIRIYSQEIDGKVKIIIEDSGIGISEKDIPRIFERFYRVDKARSRQLGGTGLGLSIVRHIIELHGGNVGVETTEGLGSKFWFILPK